MIVGIGNDLCNISRIEKILQHNSQGLIRRLFSSAEQKELKSLPNKSLKEQAHTIAKRFAAKEACSKALGTGFAQGTYFKDIQIYHHSSGQPYITLSGGALANLHKKVAHQKFLCHLSISDDYPWAQAFVIIETN